MCYRKYLLVFHGYWCVYGDIIFAMDKYCQINCCLEIALQIIVEVVCSILLAERFFLVGSSVRCSVFLGSVLVK